LPKALGKGPFADGPSRLFIPRVPVKRRRSAGRSATTTKKIKAVEVLRLAFH
jgi:hypothetical protein